ncbi:hypothetical protein KSS87_012379 [Heliosperma pusillum]|nr:hypothetical protein KSS87_012379 [Heliosperma pusillum]
MEVGQSSSSIPSNEVWAKLVPSDSKFASVEISSSDVSICSHVSSSSDKLEWCQILRNSDRCSATIRNKRSEVIIVDGTSLPSEEVVGIKCGSEIVPASVREDLSQNFGGGFVLSEKIASIRPVFVVSTLSHERILKSFGQWRLMLTVSVMVHGSVVHGGHHTYKFEVMAVQEERSENKLKILVDSEHTKCSICLNVWHDVVTVAPCLHNFWGVVHFVGRNHFLHCIEEADVSLRRSTEELAVLDSYATIKSNLVITSGKWNRRKRARSPTYEENNEMEHPSCAQCGTQIAGFRCNGSTVHLQCHSCGGMMPSRTDINIPQHCVGCDRAFCAAYWHAQGVSRTDLHAVCNLDSFKPISERRASSIPSTVHEGNQCERDITERCIRQTGKSLEDVVSEWVTKFNNSEIGDSGGGGGDSSNEWDGMVLVVVMSGVG